MANANWCELRGTRKVEDDVRYVDFICTAHSTKGALLPLLGSTFAEVMSAASSGSAPSASGLITDPEIVDVSHRRKMTENFDSVALRFRGYKTES